MSEFPAGSKSYNKHIYRLRNFGLTIGGIAVLSVFVAFWTMVIIYFVTYEAGWPSNGWTTVRTVAWGATALDIVIISLFSMLMIHGETTKNGLTAFLHQSAQGAWLQHVIGFRLFF